MSRKTNKYYSKAGSWKLIVAEDTPPEWTETKHSEHENPLTPRRSMSAGTCTTWRRIPAKQIMWPTSTPDIVEELSELLNEFRNK